MKVKKVVIAFAAGLSILSGGLSADAPVEQIFGIETVEAAVTMASYNFKTNVYYRTSSGKTYGDSAGVKRIQRALNKALGINLSVDGIFGPKTCSAVCTFQSRNGLATDCKVGVNTWGKLKKYE